MMKQVSLIEVFIPEPKEHCVISVVGGGGKTSLIFRLTDELRSAGKKVIVATTTHMRYEADRPYAENADYAVIQKNLSEYGYTVTGILDKDKMKIGRISEKKLAELKEVADVLLIEADGSRGLPLKMPESWEPAIPPETDVVISVVGMDAIGKKIEECCHRPHKVAQFLKKELRDPVAMQDIVSIAESEDGMQKNVQRDWEFHVFLNKTDLIGRQETAEEICHLLKQRNISAVCGSLRKMQYHMCNTIALVMLAAGESSRFGKNKLLYEIDGKPMFLRILQILSEASTQVRGSRLMIVTRFEEIAEKAKGFGAEVVLNDHPELGISYSMQCGISAAKTDTCLFAVSDQPWLTAETVRELIALFFKEKKGMACITDGVHTGNPCIFSRKYYQELMGLSGDRGGKKVIKKHPEDVAWFYVKSARELQDVDRRVDLSEYISGNEHDERNRDDR